MSMIVAFDTLAYARELRDAGVPEAQAEAFAKVNSRALTDLIQDRVATKDDLVALKREIKSDIALSISQNANKMILLLGSMITAAAGIIIYFT